MHTTGYMSQHTAHSTEYAVYITAYGSIQYTACMMVHSIQCISYHEVHRTVHSIQYAIDYQVYNIEHAVHGIGYKLNTA